MPKSRHTIPIPPRQGITYGDTLRIGSRHYATMCRLADEGGYTSLGQLMAVILDAVLPRVRLIERPKYDIVIADTDNDE